MKESRRRHFATTLTIRAALFGTVALGLSLTAPALADQPAPLVEHFVKPVTTDSAIDPTLADHYAWFNPSESNHQLLVYLPGNGGVGGGTLRYQQVAAQLGYDVIGLSYETNFSLSALCNTDPDPNSCFYNAHYEVTYGVDTSSKVQVSKANSIVHLLTAFLEYLAKSYPDEGWSHFLANGSPRWSSIALSGLSQGAGNAAIIAKYEVVSRVVMFSGVTDRLSGGIPGCDGASDWLTNHRTPTNRYWGLAHDRDPGYRDICANWDSLGISSLGQLVQVELSAPPYTGTHQLFTHLIPQGNDITFMHAHPSTVNDMWTPLFPDGTPKLAQAWTYLLAAKADDGD